MERKLALRVSIRFNDQGYMLTTLEAMAMTKILSDAEDEDTYCIRRNTKLFVANIPKNLDFIDLMNVYCIDLDAL